MKVVITKDQEKRYTINNYSLKVLQALPTGVKKSGEVKKHSLKSFDDKEGGEQEEKTLVDESKKNKERDDLVESLLKKADDLSSKYLKAQMQYEQAMEETQAKVQLAKDQGYQEGLAAAKEALQKEHEQKHNQVLMQLESSIATLNNQANAFNDALEGVKEELIGAVLDISKEAIQKELSADTNGVVLSLAQSLIKEVKEASRITIKVNPLQLEFVQKALNGSDKIKILADNAIREGGVILISDIGTIEADIMQRYEKIKRNALAK